MPLLAQLPVLLALPLAHLQLRPARLLLHLPRRPRRRLRRQRQLPRPSRPIRRSRTELTHSTLPILATNSVARMGERNLQLKSLEQNHDNRAPKSFVQGIDHFHPKDQDLSSGTPKEINTLRIRPWVHLS